MAEEGFLASIRKKKTIYLLAECDDMIVGLTAIRLKAGRRNHIGELGISVRKEYRGIGLGKYLLKEVAKLAKRDLNPRPKIIYLEVYINNKPAISLYKKCGFKEVARIPRSIQYKRKLIAELIMFLDL